MKIKDLCEEISICGYVRILNYYNNEVIALCNREFSEDWKRLDKYILDKEVVLMQPRTENNLSSVFPSIEIYVK